MTWCHFVHDHPWSSALIGLCQAGMLSILGEGIWIHQGVVMAVGGSGSLFVLSTFAILAALM